MMLTMFSFCRPQICGLLFLPYVVKLLSKSKYGGRRGQEIGKQHPSQPCEAERWKIESICLEGTKVIRRLPLLLEPYSHVSGRIDP